MVDMTIVFFFLKKLEGLAPLQEFIQKGSNKYWTTRAMTTAERSRNKEGKKEKETEKESYNRF